MKYPPITDNTLLSTGKFTIPWVRWFDSVFRILTGKDPLQLASYTLATLPTPIEGQMIYVSDATGGPTTAFSDGINWYVSQGVIVS